jgi:hypothetical protein
VIEDIKIWEFFMLKVLDKVVYYGWMDELMDGVDGLMDR